MLVQLEIAYHAYSFLGGEGIFVASYTGGKTETRGIISVELKKSSKIVAAS